MAKPDTRRIDRELRLLERKLDAVRNRETWPLNRRERSAVMGALASGSYRIVRGNSPSRAETRLETAWQSAETRLVAEIAALKAARVQIVAQAAAENAARKSTSRWW
ncbi:hypothetical protein KUM39_27830 [Streptomyces sp. J2-1]|uniref:hypothetical protein n=1 Tax=Streptomyces corallincola TaxID=2851888 RepID=UPI001C387639|nr:hypothetical protein [Streptomyces corallincola]MBV2358109.1 hypothetical protein [Streptomyces corallincola]